MPVGVLVAEEHADDRRNREGVKNEGLFGEDEPESLGQHSMHDRLQGERGVRCRESETWEIAKNWRKPRAPNEEFQDHHDEEPRANRGIHCLVPRTISIGPGTGKRRGYLP